LVAVGQDNRGTFFMESFGQRHADPARSTRYNSYFSAKFHACDVTHSVAIL
jgi:hypothetical protein